MNTNGIMGKKITSKTFYVHIFCLLDNNNNNLVFIQFGSNFRVESGKQWCVQSCHVMPVMCVGFLFDYNTFFTLI